MKATKLITSTILAIVISSISVHASAQHSNVPSIEGAYRAILNEGGTVKSIVNPIHLVDTLAYLEKVLEEISSKNELFRQFKPIWKEAGIKIYAIEKDTDVVIKDSKNGLYISFFDPDEMYEMMKIGADLLVSSFYPDLGIIEVPNPRSFKNLDIFAMLLAHETTHAANSISGAANDELLPYIIETMVCIQYDWGKKTLNDAMLVYKKEGMTKGFVDYVGANVPQKLTFLEDAAIVGYFLLAAHLMVEQPKNHTEFMKVIDSYNEYMIKETFKQYKVSPK